MPEPGVAQALYFAHGALDTQSLPIELSPVIGLSRQFEFGLRFEFTLLFALAKRTYGTC